MTETFGGTVKKIVDREVEISAAIKTLANTRVMVGVPAQNAFRAADADGKPSTVNNAQIAYIQENGAPELRIPPRPFLKPGIANAKQAILSLLQRAGQLALEGKPDQVERALNAVGTAARDAVKQKITDGPFLPLSERTIRARAERGRKGAKLYLAELAKGVAPKDIDPSFAKPLIDTGKLRQSIEYVIRKIGGA